MKLTSWSAAVKPDLPVFYAALLSTALSTMLLLLVWTLLDPYQERMDRFGHATIDALGKLAMEPLLKQDLLHLGVIGARLLEMPEVNAVATYTEDEQLLTMSGSMRGPEYHAAIDIEGVVVGHVRIALEPSAFDVGIWSEENRDLVATVSLVIALGVSLLTAMVWSVQRAWRAGELEFSADELGEQIRRRVARPGRSTGTSANPADGLPEFEPEPAAPVRHYLLGVNLYNQLSLQGVEREFELALCTELAEAVALEYQGHVVSLPALGALIDFEESDSDDRAFEIVCASFALARLLRDESPFGNYRLGLHLVTLPGDESLPLGHPGVKDTALLSALARDGSLAMSESMAGEIVEPERLETRAMVNVLLDELTTSGPACSLVTDLDQAYKSRVLSLVELLKDQRDSIASESTF